MISITAPKRFLIIWISLLPLFAVAQNKHECYQHASEQMKLGNFDNAIHGFHRVLFFDATDYTGDALFNLAKCYRMVGAYEKSRVFYDQAFMATESDSLKAEIVFEKAIAYTLSNNYYFALIELMNLPENTSAENKLRSHFYLGINYYQLESFGAAKKEFRKYLEAKSSNKVDSLDIWFDETRKLKRYRPNLAAFSSLIIPGSGQLYAGEGREALNSFLLVGAFDVLFFAVAKNYSFLDAYLTVFPWLQRYLFGGFKSAKRLTLERREERKDLIYRKILKNITR